MGTRLDMTNDMSIWKICNSTENKTEELSKTHFEEIYMTSRTVNTDFHLLKRLSGSHHHVHSHLPVRVIRQTKIPIKVCMLTPERARASTPAVGQWPAGRQLQTPMVNVVVLERAGVPLSVTTTGSRYWVWSLRVKVLLRATMPAVLSGTMSRVKDNF